ncbi:MAG: aspartate aminotransferase family protein [Bdellovibrionales bacterium]
MTQSEQKPAPTKAPLNETNLDPNDWNDFRKDAHKVLDACIDHLQNAKDKPWQPIPNDKHAALNPKLNTSPKPRKDIIKSMLADIMPHATGNTHPRFFGWVHGTGMPSALLGEMVAATMNSNCGGRDHAAIYTERCVLNWCKDIFDFPKTSSGLLTVGTSQATIIALVTARNKALGINIRKTGITDTPKIAVYCAEGTHACVEKALQIMGHGSDALRKIKTNGPSGSINIESLKAEITKDQSNDIIPLAIVGTAGSVNTGAFDDLNALADLCEQYKTWLHIDGAFGAWAHIADAPWSNLTNGIERADSIAFDFHKWMSVQYDCGAVLIKDSDLHYNSFAMRPAYLAEQAKGLGGGDQWFCDFGTDLSRSFRALKIWSSLQEHGLDAFSKVITENCQHASYMADLINASDALELAAPVISNVCTFFVKGPDDRNAEIVQQLQLNGDAVFSTTKIEGRTAIRAAIVNHRTRFKDIDIAINSVLKNIEG